jgi:hypothetical protein
MKDEPEDKIKVTLNYGHMITTPAPAKAIEEFIKEELMRCGCTEWTYDPINPQYIYMVSRMPKDNRMLGVEWIRLE